MATLYLDIFSGISGDMFIGALIDLGVDARLLEAELGRLGVGGYHLHVKRAQKSAIEGVKFDVHLADGHDHGPGHSHGHGHGHDHVHGEQGHSHGEEQRSFADIRRMILSSQLSEWVKQRSVSVFKRIAVAEGKIHGHPPEEVHFHEVGAIDSIVDIVGACIALEMLGCPRVLASPVVEGTGWVNCAHGRFPVPTTATLEILGAKGIALTQCEEPHELVTPTGAALLAEFVESFAPMTGLVATRVGYGLGTRDNKTRPNVLRAVLGEVVTAAGPTAHDWEADSIVVLETNLDDISSELLGHFTGRALEAGALDVFHTSIHMKKSRPGVLLSVLCAVNDADKFSELILRETTAFGVRRTVAARRKLRREFVEVDTAFGKVSVKLGKLDGRVVQAAPEFESCKAAAAKAGATVKDVVDAVHRAAAATLRGTP